MVAAKAYASGIPVWCAHDAIVDVASLVPNPGNPNKHPQFQIDLGAKIIKANGWRWPICISKRSGFITKGHGRLLFALALGASEVPVDYQDYEDEAAEWRDVLADNRLPEFADIDLELVKDILESVDALDADLTGYDPDELFKELDGSPNDAEFKEYDESVEDEVEFITCPECGHKWPK